MIHPKFWAAAFLGTTLICASTPAGATSLIDLDLPGVSGSPFLLDSFAFGISGNYSHGGGSWSVDSPMASDFTVSLPVGTASTELAVAIEKTIVFPIGDVDFFSSSSATTPYLDFHFDDAVVTGRKFEIGLPLEDFTITFKDLTVDYSQDPNRHWDALLPSSNTIQAGPFTLPFDFDSTFDATEIGDSDIVMAATIPGQNQPVPEPATLVLLGTGLLVVARRRWLRRGRHSR